MGRPALSWERPFCALYGDSWQDGPARDERPLKIVRAAFVESSFTLMDATVPAVTKKKSAPKPKAAAVKIPRKVREPLLR